MKPFHLLLTAALLGAGLAFSGVAVGDEPATDKKKDTDAAKTEKADGKKTDKDAAAKDEADSAKAAPAFELKDTNDKAHKLSDFKGKWVVLEWINHGCPFVKKFYKKGHMQALQEKYTAKKVVWLSICSSADGKQGHMSNEDWNKTIEAKKMKGTAVLVDADGKVGKLYDAKVTPTIVIVNPKGEIAFQGAVDSIRSADPADCEVADNYISQVLDAALAEKEIPEIDSAAYG